MKNLRWLFVFLLISAALLIAGCPAAPAPGSGHTISGSVRDSVTGAPIAGAAVLIGGTLARTDAAGAFSLAYASGASLTTDVFVFKGTEYRFWATVNVTIDVSTDPVYDFQLSPNDSSGYPVAALTGTLPSPASTGALITFTISNSAGGICRRSVMLNEDDTAYAVSTPTFGPDCLVAVSYSNSPQPTVIQYYQHVDLRGPTVLNIADLADTTVTVSGTAGEMFTASLDSGPCPLPMYVPFTTLSASSVDISVYNPASLPLIWHTMSSELNTPQADYQTSRTNIGLSTPFSASVALPSAAATVPAPSGILDAASVTWDAGTRTIAYGAAAGATLYIIGLGDNSNRAGYIFVRAPSASVVLPGAFMSEVIGAGSGWDGVFMPAAADRDVSEMIAFHIQETTMAEVEGLCMGAVASMNLSSMYITDLIP